MSYPAAKEVVPNPSNLFRLKTRLDAIYGQLNSILRQAQYLRSLGYTPMTATEEEAKSASEPRLNASILQELDTAVSHLDSMTDKIFKELTEARVLLGENETKSPSGVPR